MTWTPDPHIYSWWLRYSREVVDAADQHRLDCVRGGGSLGADYAPDVRWPGYLGSHYGPGGMLIVANIHRNFNSGGAETDAAFATQAANVVRDWVAGRLDDDEYLQRNADIYQVGLQSWIVGTNMGRPMRYLDVPLSAIAYTNGAKCQASDAGLGLQVKCQGRWPIRAMVNALKPRIVIISGTALAAAGDAPWRDATVVIGINQRQGAKIVARSPWQPPDGLPLFADWRRYLRDLWGNRPDG